MKHRNFILLVLLSVISIFALSSIPQFNQPTSAQTNKAQISTDQKPVRLSPRIKTIIKGAEKPNQIPDLVAYELFLRTVAENNARDLVKRAGFKDEDVERILHDAERLNDRLTNLDGEARRVKEKITDSSNLQTNSHLMILQAKKDEYVAETINHFLPRTLGNAGISKLQDFIKTNVKGNTLKVLIKDYSQTSKLPLNKSFIHSFTGKQSGSGGQLYLYSAAWRDGTNVYGSGSLSEQYYSNTSYRVTTTVTAPSGRANTTVGDWNYATLSNDTGLSVGVENGTYTTQAIFEEQSGYYDEYGNFYGSGSSFVGSSTDSLLIRPLVSITAVSPTSFPFNRTNTTSVTFTANIGLSAIVDNLPLPLKIAVEFNEQSNPGAISYAVYPNEGINPPARRFITITQNNPGGTVGAGFRVEPSYTLNSGTVRNQFRIAGVFKVVNNVNVELVAGQDFEYGTRTADVSFTVPPPQTTAGGIGGCSGEETAFAQQDCEEGGGTWKGCRGCYSPIVVDVSGNGYNLTDALNGVEFDLTGDGVKDKLSWTSAGSDDAWLFLDRNQNRTVDNGEELFGNYTPQPTPPAGVQKNGFLALAEFDKAEKGGNADGVISRLDTAFAKLRLWQDANHNGVSEPEELHRLPALDIVAISFDYKQSKRTDEFGNRFRFRAKVRDSRNIKVGRWAWDVFLTAAP